MYRIVRKVGHISVISEPGGQYIGRVTPKTGTGNDIVKIAFDYMKKTDMDMSTVVAIGSDGTVANTG